MQNKRNINSFGITLNRYCMLHHVLGEGGTICYIRYSGRGGRGRELYVTTGTLGRRRVRYSGEGGTVCYNNFNQPTTSLLYIIHIKT